MEKLTFKKFDYLYFVRFQVKFKLYQHEKRYSRLHKKKNIYKKKYSTLKNA